MKIGKDINSYKALKSHSYVACDFCDKKFNNRYDSIVHNASHIIIPLWAQTLYRCNFCDIYTTTVENIEAHNCKEHPVPVKKEEDKNEKYKIKKETLPAEYNNSEVNIKDEVKLEINDVQKLVERNVTENRPLLSRLKFEDDVVLDTSVCLIERLVADCKVNFQIIVTNKGLINNKVNDALSTNTQANVKEPMYNSIHYSSLIKPGIFSCKYCSKSYPNRFSLIKHEMHHIKILRGKPMLCLYCDRFIAGNYRTLNSHISQRHPNVREKKFKTFICKRCGLRFRKYKRHVRNYHIHDCLECGLELNNAEENASHMESCKCPEYKPKMLKVCELCFSFMKKRINLIYSLVGDTDNELGVRYPCDNCGKKYFVLKMVKRLQKKRKCCYRDRKILTNEDRLKNIQHRLKRLNLLNKF